MVWVLENSLNSALSYFYCFLKYNVLCLRASLLTRDDELYRRWYNGFESLRKETKKGNTKEGK